MTQTATPADLPVKIAPSSRWLRLLLALLATGVLAALLWVALVNRTVVSDADRRNEADLAIVAGGLEQWSEAISGLARASFIRGRVAPLSQSDRDYSDGWRYRAWMRHPALDEFKIDYTVTRPETCVKIRERINKAEGPLPFVENYYDPGSTYLKFVGSFPLSQIWGQDTGRGVRAASSTSLALYLRDIVIRLAPDARKPGIGDVICYAAGIPLERLLVIDKAAHAFSTLMIVDHDRRIVAKVGEDKVPITSLNGLAPANSILTTTLAASLGQLSAPNQNERKLADSLDPVDLNIGGRNYVAYVRPFAPRHGFDVCDAATPTASLPAIALTVGTAAATGVARTVPATRTQSPLSDTTIPLRATSDCLVVALAPKATVWRQVIGLPPLIGVSLGLAVLILIALLPSLRLILLGPGEAISRSEAVGVVLGIPAVTSLATLALLFMFDISAHRAAAHAEATQIAGHAAFRARIQIQRAVDFAREAGTNVAAATFPAPVAASMGMDQPSIVGCDSQEGASRPGAIDRLLTANPRPVCRDTKRFCRYLPYSGLPVLDTINLFDEDGQQLAGSRITVCRGFAGGRGIISARDYFVRLRAGSDPTREGSASSRPSPDNSPLLDSPANSAVPYVVAHVAALQDGIAKSIVALKATPADPDTTVRDTSRFQPYHHGHRSNFKKPLRRSSRAGQPPVSPLNPSDPRNRIFVVGSTALTEVIAPVLPPPYGLMIVDTRSNDLRVLLHPTPGRSGTETLARMLPRLASIRGKLRAALLDAQDSGQPVEFTGFYDGTNRVFIARPIAGTGWVAIAYYGLTDVDAVAARTVLRTLQSWAAFSIVSVGAWLIWLLWTGRHGWPRLWPQGARARDYDRLAIGFTALGIAGGVFLVLSPASAPLGAGSALLAGFAIRILAAVALHFVLGRRMTTGKMKLSSATQRSYMRMLAPLLLCLSLIPMGGFWLEARQYTLMESRKDTLDYFFAPGGVLETNRLTFDRMRWAYGLTRHPRTADGHIPGAYDVYSSAEPPSPADTKAAFFSSFFARLADKTVTPIPGCPSRPRSSSAVQLCQNGGQRGIELGTPRPFQDGLDHAAPYLLVILALAFFFALPLLLARVLRALAGFGIALNAADSPHLFLGDLWEMPKPKPGQPLAVLNRKSLLVNAPWVVFAMLHRGGVSERLVRFDVSDPTPKHVSIHEGSIIIVTGLELVLADRSRRLRALERLEQICHTLARFGPKTKTRLIIMTESAPLERIMDAFERDDTRPKFDAERENLRWSRLFEDFGTFSFDQPTLTSPLQVTKRGNIARGRIADAVLEECRWLPPRIVNGGIGREILLGDDVVDSAVVPIDDKIYQSKWRMSLIKWTLARNFPGRNAARAYLRNQFIEYYQRLWLSSTDAEHLVMHNMAHYRFVNIGAALAFTSLVRRGIVVLDPEPRLMNKSFGMFVRQAEKLGTIMEWRKSVPEGAWATARLPIFAAIGLAITILIGVLMISGEQTSAMLPVLAAGLPAIVAATRRILRQ